MTSCGHITGDGVIVGDLVGSFRVTDVLKVRSCAAIYRAVSSDGTAVAVKTACRRAPSAVMDRFTNEREILRTIDTTVGAPRLIGEGFIGAQRFFAIEWRYGESLTTISRRLRDHSTRLSSFMWLAVPIVRAVARLHACGVAHGDLSRANIVTSADGEVSIIDFDSAVRTGAAMSRIRRKTTWAYAPPEFARGRGGIQPSVTADQYALAAVLFRQVSSRRHRARHSDGEPRDAKSVLDARPRRVPEWVRQSIPGLQAIMDRAMHVDPTRRFESTDDFADALETALSRR